MKRVAVLGATSAMARALCREFAGRGDRLFLAARSREDLEAQASDLRLRYGVEVETGLLQAEDRESHAPLIEEAIASLGGLDGVVLALGALGRQPQDSRRAAPAARLVDVNLTAPVSLLTIAAERLEEQRSGFIVAFGSVAGDRGRQSNYAYGAAKAGLDVFMQGLRHRLEPMGIRVLTIKPGFVDTEMTWGLPGLFLVASPHRVARTIAKTLEKRAGVLYVPGFWRYIMMIIRHIPSAIFHRSRL